MTEAAIHSGLARDLYAALGESLGGNRWVVRVLQALHRRIWWGCGFMALGGFWAVLDRRYRPRALAAATGATWRRGARRARPGHRGIERGAAMRWRGHT